MALIGSLTFLMKRERLYQPIIKHSLYLLEPFQKVRRNLGTEKMKVTC